MRAIFFALALIFTGQSLAANNYYWRTYFSGTSGDYRDSVQVAADCATLAPLIAAEFGIVAFASSAQSVWDQSYGCTNATTTIGSDFVIRITRTTNGSLWIVHSILTNYAGVPGAPTNLVAQVGVAGYSAEVYFQAPASDGQSAITGYTVTASPGNISATGSASPIVLNGLTAGTQYTFTAIATNAIGNSVPSTGVAFTGRSIDPDRPIHAIIDSISSYGASSVLGSDVSSMPIQRILVYLAWMMALGLGIIAGQQR